MLNTGFNPNCLDLGMACLQGAGDVRDRPRGWSLAHLAAALGRAAALAVLLSHGASAAGQGSMSTSCTSDCWHRR